MNFPIPAPAASGSIVQTPGGKVPTGAMQSLRGIIYGRWWVLPGDVPLSTDFDGDGRTDLTVYRPGGAWFIRYSSTGFLMFPPPTLVFGLPGDAPLSGDFDGDGKAELAVFRPSEGNWYFQAIDYLSPEFRYQWGLPGDLPVP